MKGLRPQNQNLKIGSSSKKKVLKVKSSSSSEFNGS